MLLNQNAFYLKLLLLCFGIYLCNNSNAQNNSDLYAEYQHHRNTLGNHFQKGDTDQFGHQKINRRLALFDYIIDKRLVYASDKRFLCNRRLLDPFDSVFCDTNKVRIRDTLKNGSVCEVKVDLIPFDTNGKNMVQYKGYEWPTFEKINNQTPYGGTYGYSKWEIKELAVIINGRKLPIPKYAYSNFYDPLWCVYRGSPSIKAFESLDGKYIYVYIHGSTAADAYVAKLIFNHKKYLSQIVLDYYGCTTHGVFSKNPTLF